jgi:hypothetical protein
MIVVGLRFAFVKLVSSTSPYVFLGQNPPTILQPWYVFSTVVELVAPIKWRNAIPSDFIPIVPPLRDNRYR